MGAMTSPSLPSRNWTLAVVSLATAMLMLDIAVVNTALPSIATDLETGLSGLQWVVDAYTLALASTVLSAGFLADRLGRRPRRTGLRRRDPVRGRPRAARQRVPGREGPHVRHRRLGRHHRRLVRHRPAGRRRAHLRAELAVDLPRQRADRRRRTVDHAHQGPRVA
jgi:hypothetical protein